MGAGGVSLRRVLLDLVPDAPLRVETRAALLRPSCEVFGDPGAPERAVIRETSARLVATVGRPEPDLLYRATAGLKGHWDVIGPIEQHEYLAALLPDWRPEPAIYFDLPPGAAPGSTEDADLRFLHEPCSLDHLRGELKAEIERCLGRAPMVACLVEGQPVSFCYSYLETESFWAVAIATVDGYRRRGLAEACARRLIAYQLDRSKIAVWGALERNVASRELARKLGFRPVGRLAVVERQPESTKM